METHGRAIVGTMSWKNRKGALQYYDITELDYDTLVRACAHEGNPHAEVVRCLLQRYAWISPNPHYRQMQDFVRAYVQPINPRWATGGDRLKREVARLKRRGEHGKALDQVRRGENRQNYIEQPIESVEGRYHTVVKAVLGGGGTWSHLQGAVHYRAGRGSDDVEGKELAEDFADDRDNYFVVDSGHGFKARTTWFFGVGKSKTLELTTTWGGAVVEPMTENEWLDAIFADAEDSYEPRMSMNDCIRAAIRKHCQPKGE